MSSHTEEMFLKHAYMYYKHVLKIRCTHLNVNIKDVKNNRRLTECRIFSSCHDQITIKVGTSYSRTQKKTFYQYSN